MKNRTKTNVGGWDENNQAFITLMLINSSYCKCSIHCVSCNQGGKAELICASLAVDFKLACQSEWLLGFIDFLYQM